MIARVFKWGARLCLILLLAIVGYWTFLYQQIRDSAVRDEARPSDTIVVMGAAQYNGKPSPVLKARLDHALTLFHKGYAKAIITTGGYGPDPNFSEGSVSAQYLAQQGIDKSSIVTEQGSGTTRDSIRAATALMQSKSWKTALVVSDGFHLFRVKRMFEDEGIAAYTSPAPNSPIEIASSQRFWHSLREVLMFSAYRLGKL